MAIAGPPCRTQLVRRTSGITLRGENAVMDITRARERSAPIC
jgi:hypothetical protein